MDLPILNPCVFRPFDENKNQRRHLLNKLNILSRLYYFAIYDSYNGAYLFEYNIVKMKQKKKIKKTPLMLFKDFKKAYINVPSLFVIMKIYVGVKKGLSYVSSIDVEKSYIFF